MSDLLAQLEKMRVELAAALALALPNPAARAFALAALDRWCELQRSIIREIGKNAR